MPSWRVCPAESAFIWSRPFFDSGEADGHLFYVMPYAKGETLRARLESERRLPVYEMLTGQPPHTGPTTPALVAW